jgi:prepilin-type N-terminal cleavage/methylation domain-containing protein
MKRLHKNSRGFTLIEIIIVIAIIVILASVMFIVASSYINRAEAARDKVSLQHSAISSANQQINQDFVDLGY